MSNDYVVTSKEVRPEFTAELLYDESPDNPRERGTQINGIYFWNDKHENLSDSRDIRSYEEAIRELYEKVYPELVGWLLEEQPPQEILDLIDHTPYPGTIRWLNVMDSRIETRFIPMTYPDAENPGMGGVAFISDEKLQEEGFTREEGEILIENNLLELEQYINGNVYILRIHRDGEDECVGDIYPMAQTDTKAGRMTLVENTHTPRDEDLDDYLLEMGISPEDELLVRAASWDR